MLQKLKLENERNNSRYLLRIQRKRKEMTISEKRKDLVSRLRRSIIYILGIAEREQSRQKSTNERTDIERTYRVA